MRTRDRKRAIAHTNAIAGVVQAPLNRKPGRKPKHQPTATPQQLAFRDYVALGYTSEQARSLAGMPQLDY